MTDSQSIAGVPGISWVRSLEALPARSPRTMSLAKSTRLPTSVLVIPLRTSSPSSATYELGLTDVGRSRLPSIHTTRRRTPSEHAAWPHLRDRTHAGRRGARRVDQLLDQPLPLEVSIDRKETRAINFRRVLEAPGDGAHELAGPS